MTNVSGRASFLEVRERSPSGVLRTAAIACSVGLLMAVGGTAQAAVVSEWDFDINSAFDYTATTDNNGDTPGGVSTTAGTGNPFWEGVLGIGNAPASMYWGEGRTPPNVSGVTIGKTNVSGQFEDAGPHTENGVVGGPGSYAGRFDGTGDGAGVTTNAGFVQTVNFTHHNAVIPLGTELESSAVLNQLNLTPAAGGDSETLSLMFNVLFTETTNSASPPSNPDNDDIFVISPAAGAFDGNTISQNFTFDGQPYRVDLRLNGLEMLNAAQCTIGGAAPGCSGLRTTEGENNTFMAELAITAIPGPPAGLLLFSALAGLGVVARRKKMQKTQAA